MLFMIILIASMMDLNNNICREQQLIPEPNVPLKKNFFRENDCFVKYGILLARLPISCSNAIHFASISPNDN
jgi:hypothetical protein